MSPPSARPALHLLEFSVGAVDLHADARPDHDADHGVSYRLLESHRDTNGARFSAAPHQRGSASAIERFDGEQTGAPVATAHGRIEGLRDRGGPLTEPQGDMGVMGGQHLARVAAPGKRAVAEPPDFVAEIAQQILFVAQQKNRGAASTQTFEAEA